MEIDTSTRDAVAEVAAELTAAGSAEPVTAEPAAEPAASAEPAVEAAPAGDRARGADGKFVKADTKPASPVKAVAAAAAAPGPEAAGQGAVASAAAPVLPELKAPADWRAGPREKFKDLPREIQEEAIRLYTETRKTLDEAAGLRKEVGPWKETIAPYEPMFKAAGLSPQQAVGNVLQRYAALQTAPLQVRSQILADLVRAHLGTDEAALTMLGKELDAKGGSPVVQPAPRQLGPEDLDRWYEERRQRESREAAVGTWRGFEASKPEFLDEPGFRQRLALEVQIALQEKGGGQPTQEDFKRAYDAACQTHPAISKILNQRKEAEAAKAKAASTPGSAAAAAGVKSEPAGPSGGDGPAETTRDQVEREWKQQRQRARV